MDIAAFFNQLVALALNALMLFLELLLAVFTFFITLIQGVLSALV